MWAGASDVGRGLSPATPSCVGRGLSPPCGAMSPPPPTFSIMTRPPRVDAPGEVRLVTTPTWQRKRILDRNPVAQSVVATLIRLECQHEFDLWAWVLMPDHAHFVLQPIERSLDACMRRLKSLTWRGCRDEVGLVERLWQDGFHDRGLRSERALQAAVDYVHMNPVKAQLVEHPEGWKWSSYRSLVAGDKPRPT